MLVHWKMSRSGKALLGAFLLGTGTVHALDPTKSVFQYNCQNWTRQNGLPADFITAVTQTKDGYLWLGTQKGLFRFGGIDFKARNIALPPGAGHDIKGLCAGRKGGLWVCPARGGFGFYDGQQFSPAGEQTASTLLEISDGSVLAGGDFGLGQWIQQNGQPRQSFSNNALGNFFSFSEGAQGRVWVGTVEHGLWSWQNGKLIPFPDEALKKESVSAVAEDLEGQIWVGTQKDLRCFDSKFQPKQIPPFQSEVKAILVDRQGLVWIATAGAGLARFQNGQFTFFRKADGLASDFVTSLYEDREGSIWVGTQSGLTQITDVKLPVFSTREGLPYGAVISVCNSRKGGLWLTTDTGLAYFDGRAFTNFANNPSLPQSWMKRVFEARNGDLYLVTDHKELIVCREQKPVMTFTNSDWPVALTEDAEGVFVAVAGKIFRIQNDRLVPYVYAKGADPVFYWINNLSVAGDGALWVASNTGIFRVKDGNVRQWSASNGLSDNRVLCIFEDTDGAIWAGSAGGIARLKSNEIKMISPEQGLPADTVYAIVPDDLGNFWMDTSSGILKATRRNLNDLADGKVSRVECTLFDGLESVKFTGRAAQEAVACKTADGRLWFPSPQGVTMVDPAHMVSNTIAPSVHIEEIRINGVPMENRPSPALRPGGGQMEFYFTALSYIAPQKIRLRYQLAGFDKEWIEAEGRRSVLYNNLRPGQYVFRVQACNADGLWNTEGDSFAVELPPALFQTTWFFLFCGALGLSVIGFILRWLTTRAETKQRKLKAQNDLLDSKVRQRTAELAEANQALAAEIEASERAEEALRTEQRLLRTMIDALPIYIACLDKNGRYVFANNLVRAFFGKRVSEIEGKHFTEVMPGPMRDKHQALIAACLAGKVVPFVDEFTLGDGAKIIGQGVFAPLTDKNGHVTGAVCGVMDITERRRAEEELLGKNAFFEALVESSLDGILVVGKDRKKILQNQQVIDLWQLPVSLASGTDDEDQARYLMNMTNNPEQFLANIDYLYEHPKETDRREIELKNGTVLDRYSSSVIGKDGRYYGRIWMFRDITVRKQLELEMEQTHQQLMAASRQAGMAEVATGVLHNVGNVLNSVNVSANLVANSIRASRAATLARVVELLHQHAGDLADFITRDERGRNLPVFLAHLHEHLQAERAHLLEELRSLIGNIEHINEIVAVQQANARRVGVIESVLPSELMENALKMNAATYHCHQVEIIRDFEKAPPLQVDKHKVLQILINLLQNAKRACGQSSGNRRCVTVRVRRHGERAVRLEVADNGIGIPAENLTRIFAHGFTTQKDGHGFGLHSGALTAKDLGGTLAAYSDGPGHGSTFILELPLEHTASAASISLRVSTDSASSFAPDRPKTEQKAISPAPAAIVLAAQGGG